MITLTAAVAGIGRDGTIPWRLPGELARTAALTRTAPEGKQNALVMGAATWASLPRRPLPGRLNAVVSRGSVVPGDGYLVRADLRAAVEELVADPGIGDVYIFGGEAVYAEALRLLVPDRLLITRVPGEFGSDRFLAPIPAEYRLSGTESARYGETTVAHETWLRG